MALVAGTAVALAAAPTSGAAPDCSDAGPTVTFCQTKGSNQLTTTPPAFNYGGWNGIGVWPLIGAFGIGP
ncbi:hypothetical protein ACQI4F_09780 [Mycolicibacterium vaccae]|uniref:hypothetical protein n=1 Tax=Mycolicibacterium vaccae TaxID=1810 RepID=UPI003CEC3E42